MTEQDRKQFAALISALCLTFSKDPSEALFLGYWMGLKTLSLRDLERAIQRATETCKFMPKPVELRELAGERTAEHRAELAWNALNAAVPIGSYKHVDFDDPLINATVRSHGGWPAILEKSSEEWDKWFRKEFIKTYIEFYNGGVNGEVCDPLPGLSDSGVRDVLEHDGQIRQVDLGGAVRIETGLPALPAVVRERIAGVVPDTLKLELQKS